MVTLASTELRAARRVMRDLCKPGQRRLHMKSESDPRRRQILSTISSLPVQAHIYEARLGARSERAARDECLRALIGDLMELGASQLVIESCDQDRHDNLTIRDALLKEQATDVVRYRHVAPAAEPLLWLPDIAAWAFGKRGDWRRRMMDLVATITSVDP